MTNNSDLELVSLTKRYGKTIAVDAISHHFKSGVYACLLGPSGCGKSSTLRMIAGHEDASGGSIVLGGRDVSYLPPANRGTAMMFQNYALFPHLTVIDNVAFSLKMRGVATEERRKRAMSMLDLVDMAALSDRLPAQLSGGQQQRLSVVLALIGSPRVVLLDELTTGLDPDARRTVWHLIEDLRADGVTILLVSHHMDEVHRLCDRITVLNRGSVVATGTPDSLIADAGLGGDHRATLEDAFLTLTDRSSA